MKNEGKKICKHCKAEIPENADICPECNKKQSSGAGLLFLLLIVAVVLILIGVMGILKMGKKHKTHNRPVTEVTREITETTTETGKNTTEVKQNTTETEKDTTEEEIVTDPQYSVVENDRIRIRLLSAEPYEDDSIYLDEGKELIRFRFEIENPSDEILYLYSFLDWKCIADGEEMNQEYILEESADSGLDQEVKAGGTVKGSLFFSMPVHRKSVEIRYENYDNTYEPMILRIR